MAGPEPIVAVQERPRRARQLGPEAVTQLVTRYEAGATVYELAEEFGVHRVTVSEHLHRLGVVMRRVSMNERQVARAAALYRNGMSLARIGDVVGFDGETVRQALRTMGVAMRDPHSRQS